MAPAYAARPKSHIERRRNQYYAVLDVPPDARDKLGKTKLTKTLRTDSLSTAEKRAGPILARWRREIDKARGEPVETDADFFRRMLTPAEIAAIREIKVVELPDGRTLEFDAATNEPIKDDAVLAEPGSEIAFGDGTSRRFSRTSARRSLAPRFHQHVAEWHGTTETTQKTKDMQAADIAEFTAKFRSVDSINKPAVKRWAEEAIAAGITAKTMVRKLSALRGYWRHLQSVNVAPDGVEPFSGLNIGAGKKGGRVKREDRRQPFTAGEVVKLLQAARKREDAELADLIELDRWTGMRIEEACSLKIEDAKISAKIPYFAVNEGKTDAAIREVPIHPRLLPVVKRLVKASKDGYLLSGLTENKYGDRSNAIGKRFGHLKTALGFGDQYVFHSIRKGVATQFENASVTENVAADIIGHDKPTMTYGLYSGGTSLAVKRKAIGKLSYGR